MSFRSNIRILISKEGFDFIEEAIEENEKALLKFDYYNNYLGDRNEIIFGWDYIQWNMDRPIVKAINKTLENLEENNIAFKMIQMDEDGEVIEKEFNSDTFSAYLETSLEFVMGVPK